VSISSAEATHSSSIKTAWAKVCKIFIPIWPNPIMPTLLMNKNPQETKILSHSASLHPCPKGQGCREIGQPSILQTSNSRFI
jgi:hypothetical protein